MNLRNVAFKTILNGLWAGGLPLLFSRHAAGLGAVLMLHHVRNHVQADFSPNAHLSVTPQFLEDTLKMLRQGNIDIVTMNEAVERIGNGDTGNRFVAFTFDDGYRDNAEVAAPIMRKYEAPYTIYVATGLVEGIADLWWDGLESIIRKQPVLLVRVSGENREFVCETTPQKAETYKKLIGYLTEEAGEEEQRRWIRDLASLHHHDLDDSRKVGMMTWQEIRALASDPLCTIGAHTIHHYALARLSAKEAHFEMREGARIIEAELGEYPRHFAYPYGYPAAAGPRDFEIACDLGFKSAVTTRPGVIYPEHKDHMTALPRISLNGHFQRGHYTKTLLSGWPTLLANKMGRINVR